ncbi:chromosome segregation protein [Rubricella aquisinus]|uniref:Chromosome partition protein Smc n=1 Tax=Rubricella aquisinus TaxID=2028108 RepID=A0A840X8H1_9RHOB|nr:chromosome segregation protein [Rubricella aquisinus]
MQFTKLRLVGFKSFVDPTELLIHRGLTGVVGPNGCGKSNLLEALRWVMGENRPTAMRGTGMEDVIFAGAASRPARNYAEVTLTVDNSDRLAPPAFNQTDKLEVVRRITRDAGSAYKANGAEARARDVQMLFADASTGSHSPALVRQGQISELINAKPRARRRILEEAAGISGLYQRRHEAELKLKATTANLERVDDVLGQLEGRLQSLARQARQAARYREIAGELRQSEALLLYRRWREAEAAHRDADQALTEATAKAGRAQAEAAAAARTRAAATEAMPPLREEEAIAGAVLQRLTVEKDTLDDRENRARRAIERLKQTIQTLERDIEREQTLNKDAGETIDRLDWEERALKEASAGQEDALRAASAKATEAAGALEAQEAQLDRLSEDAARLKARHQAAERRLEEARRAEAKLTDELARAEAQSRDIATELTAAADRVIAAQKARALAEEAANDAETTLAAAETSRSAAQTAEADARAALSGAEGEATALRAEVAALDRLLAREAGSGAQLLDEVRAAPGYEAALGAALGDDLKAPQLTEDGTGWTGLEGYANPTPLPAGAAPLAPHVTAPAVLARRLGAIGVVAAADGAALQADLKPGQRLVSREGDLWRWDGFRIAAADAPSATALRLEQRNRRDALAETLATAEAALQEAAARHAEARGALQAATEADQAARRARKDADEALTNATRALSRAEADQGMLDGRAETLRLAVERRKEEMADAAYLRAEAEQAATELDDLGAVASALEEQKTIVAEARATMIAARSTADEVRREGDARTRRIQQLTKELSGWRLRLDTADKRIAELSERRDQSRAELASASAAPDEIIAKRAEVQEALRVAETRRKAAADALAVGETALKQADEAERTAERAASDAREARARSEAVSEAAAAHAAETAERIREDLSVAPEKLLETLDADPEKIPSAEAIEMDIIRLRRQRDALGAVNLRADEDAREVETERAELAAERHDLGAAVDTLKNGIASLNKEGRERLLAAFDEVNANFGELFRHLFGGGEAKLELIESDDPLEAGLEIMCQPPGKNLSTLSLLSGGEQTLTALSLIFAVFRANPSPICVLDEVDAPLDDANVTRFCDLLDEMTRQTRTRFLIITHHAVTMARMDRLFGVTMAEKGVSQLVSVDLTRAEEIVASA